MAKQAAARSSATPKNKAKAKESAQSPKAKALAEKTRHLDRRNADAQALRSLQSRFPTMTLAQLTEKQGATGKTWQDLVRDEFMGKGTNDRRIRDKKWRELSKIYNGEKQRYHGRCGKKASRKCGRRCRQHCGPPWKRLARTMRQKGAYQT